MFFMIITIYDFIIFTYIMYYIHRDLQGQSWRNYMNQLSIDDQDDESVFSWHYRGSWITSINNRKKNDQVNSPKAFSACVRKLYLPNYTISFTQRRVGCCNHSLIDLFMISALQSLFFCWNELVYIPTNSSL